jgi:hypothetical protein
MSDNGEYFIRCGFGRKSRQLSYGGPPPDSVPASEWMSLRDTALAIEHVTFNEADFDGRIVGKAFLEHVIWNPKIQAQGEWLCLERPTFRPLFAEGRFPAVARDERRSSGRTRTAHRPPFANLGYAEFKENMRGLPRGTLSNVVQPLGIFPAPHASISLTWGSKWPVVLDAEELGRLFVTQYSPEACYQDDPSEGPIYSAAMALADQHRAFFDPLREGRIVAGGTFKDRGQDLPVPAAQWSRSDRFLDIENGDLFDGEGEAARAIWESLTLRIPNREMTNPRRARPADRAFDVRSSSRPAPPTSHGEEAAVAAWKRGRKQTVGPRIEEAMRRDIKEGRHTPKSLAEMLEKQMADRYGASRDTCRKARTKVLSGIHF